MLFAAIVWMTMTAAVGQTSFNLGVSNSGNLLTSVEGFGCGIKGGIGLILPNKNDTTFTGFGVLGYGFPILKDKSLVIRPGAVVAGVFKTEDHLHLGLDLKVQFRVPPKENPNLKHLGFYADVLWKAPLKLDGEMAFGSPKLNVFLGIAFIP